jgi:hypothetical protein
MVALGLACTPLLLLLRLPKAAVAPAEPIDAH